MFFGVWVVQGKGGDDVEEFVLLAVGGSFDGVGEIDLGIEDGLAVGSANGSGGDGVDDGEHGTLAGDVDAVAEDGELAAGLVGVEQEKRAVAVGAEGGDEAGVALGDDEVVEFLAGVSVGGFETFEGGDDVGGDGGDGGSRA